MVDEVKPLIRVQTPDEKADFIDISRRHATPEMVLRAQIAEAEQKANAPKIPFDKKLPYPGTAVIEDFNKAAKMAELSAVGYVGNKKVSETTRENLRKEALKNMDWTKYTDPKNFLLIDSSERIDEHLTKTNPGKSIFVKKRSYTFKGHVQKYVVMEDAASAINRA